MLIIGNFGLSVDQAKAQMALWCIMAAPLMMGESSATLLSMAMAFLIRHLFLAVRGQATTSATSRPR